MPLIQGILCFFLLWASFAEASTTPIVEANINQNSGQINFPLKGTVTITHDSESEVDLNSFRLDEKAVEVSIVKNVYLAGDTVVSFYSFTLPAQDAGTHILPPFSVKVGNKTYQSLPASYSVTDTGGSSITPPTTGSDGPSILRLEAFVQGPSTLYLGDRTTLVYRISYNRSIDLTKSELPFIHVNSFLKVGDAQISDAQQGNLTIQQISQMVEASQFGTFKIGPSFIEGQTYQINDSGQKVYDKQLLRAEAPAIEIIVKQFPTDNQPASFNGALGKIRADISMKTAAAMEIGDTIRLIITLSGVDNLAELHLPDLSCQPMFSGMFQVSDLPPVSEIKDNEKLFQVEIRPISGLVKEIPSIEFSSFDLASKQFHLTKTDPISINISAALSEKSDKNSSAMPQQNLPSIDTLQAMLNQTMPPVEPRGQSVSINNSQIPLLQRGWVMIILPLGLLFLLWQFRKQKEWSKRPKPKKHQSELYLMQAMQMQENQYLAIRLLEKAVWSYLKELDEKSAKIDIAADLSNEGNIGKARALLLRMQFIQYSPEKTFDFPALVQETSQLLRSVQNF